MTTQRIDPLDRTALAAYVDRVFADHLKYWTDRVVTLEAKIDALERQHHAHPSTELFGNPRLCRDCDGSGWSATAPAIEADPCPTCKGTGRER